MTKKSVSSLVAPIEHLEKNARLVDLVIKALPLEKLVKLFNEWRVEVKLSRKSLLRIMQLSKNDVSNSATRYLPYVIHVKGAGYIASGDIEVFTLSIEKAKRFTMPEAIAAVLGELEAYGWKRKAIEVTRIREEQK